VALSVTLNGVVYSIPEPSESGYGASLDAYLKALATAFPPLGGGTASLTAELDMGASFGLKALYFKGRTANPASAGILRVAAADSMGWRNQANSGDVLLSKDAGDALLFNGANVTGNPFLDASSTAGQSIANGATEVIVVFGTATVDSDSGLNTGTGRYTVPTGKGGDYQVSGQIAYNTAPTGTCTLSVYKNAALVKSTQFIAPGAAQTIQISVPLRLVAGDILDLRSKHGNGAPQNLVATAGVVFFGLKRIAT
jgi:hypothetical protein